MSDDMSRFEVMYARGLGGGTEGDQEAQGQNGTHRIAPWLPTHSHDVRTGGRAPNLWRLHDGSHRRDQGGVRMLPRKRLPTGELEPSKNRRAACAKRVCVSKYWRASNIRQQSLRQKLMPVIQ
jgi:hypothetical protein